MMDQVMKLANGNPGAATCVMGLLMGPIENSVAGLTILPKIEEYGIVGTDLYVLFSDICNKDYQLMAELLKIAPREKIIEASSKQDYSGRTILMEYLKSIKS